MNTAPLTATSFYAFLQEHKLMGTRCTHCGALYLPPRPLCPHCPEAPLEWVELSGKGEVVAFSVIAIGLTAMQEMGYSRENPYVSAMVRLVEGPIISAQLLGVEARHPETIAIGMPVRMTFVERGPQDARKTYLAFEPIAEGGA